jgi:uncharacterized protein YkwD
MLVSVVIASTVVPQARDFWHIDNGAGGPEWKIGVSEVAGIPAHQPRSLADSRSLALNLVNRDRKLNGLAPLVEDPLLAQAAQLHAQDMLDRSYYGHINPEGQSPTDRFARLGGQAGVGENINRQDQTYGINLNYRLVEIFHKSWMYSKGHRENLLEADYGRFGYGIAVDSARGQAYAVQKFARGGM